MVNVHSWFLVVNPNSGTRNFQRSWSQIQQLLTARNVDFSFAFTQQSKEEIQLVDAAVKQGFRNIVAVGGDGTLHHVVNGILRQRYVKSSEIKLGVIPLGTGNDWIKTYGIPNSIAFSIEILLENYTTFQDVGVIETSDGTKEYYNNLAGIGYDGYVVNKLKALKRLGSIAYLISGLQGLLFYKKSNYTLKIEGKTLNEKCLMILFGIGQYSGGGMQMTKDVNPNDGLLDITIAKNFSFFDLVFNLPKLYNGQIVDHKKVATYKVKSIEITENNLKLSWIEADGELIGKGSLKVSILPSAIQILVKS
jgi:YegS/Rv2252/BmrU family lipid kinase